jgi:hypothetical protein
VFAGRLYGLWVGRSTSARRLKWIGPLLTTDTSMVLALADGLVNRNAIDMLTATASQSVVLSFNPTEQGVVLAIA